MPRSCGVSNSVTAKMSKRAYAIGMAVPEGPWQACENLKEADLLIFAPDTALVDAELYVINRALLQCPAFYWQHRPAGEGREMLLPVLSGSDEQLRASVAPRSQILAWSIPAESDELEAFYPRFKQLLKNIIKGYGASWQLEVLFAALREGIENGARHGCKWQSHESIKIELSHGRTQLRVKISDSGPGFEWRSLFGRALTSSPAEIARSRGVESPGGMGMPMMARALDVVKYNRSGNQLLMGMG